MGIGTVELPVKKIPNDVGPQSHGILRLHNVLYVPTATCNIIGSPIADEYTIVLGPQTESTQGIIMDKGGMTAAYFVPLASLFQVKLADPPVGPRVGPIPFDSSKAHFIKVRWENTEREKWEASRAAEVLQATEPPFSAEEKKFLKKHWGGEYRFLLTYGLSIFKEEDREEGRGILRALMTGSDADVEWHGLEDIAPHATW